MDAVGKSYPAVEESSHGIYVFVPRLPARTGRGVDVMLAGWMRFVGQERGLGAF